MHGSRRCRNNWPIRLARKARVFCPATGVSPLPTWSGPWRSALVLHGPRASRLSIREQQQTDDKLCQASSRSVRDDWVKARSGGSLCDVESALPKGIVRPEIDSA